MGMCPLIHLHLADFLGEKNAVLNSPSPIPITYQMASLIVSPHRHFLIDMQGFPCRFFSWQVCILILELQKQY
jgi:hypothetical protein